MPDDSTDDDVGATIQVRSGERPDAIQPTIRGNQPVTHEPPSIPPPRYELGEEIARGGMGRVVEATDTQLGRVVALKEALALDADSLKRFERETQITARLEHPAIVPVHDAGTMAGGIPFYVMRKIGGRPLEKLVGTSETLNERLALIPHVIATAHAIAHAHSRGIIHRDIKPSNILCGEYGETILIDWGLAKVKGEPEDPVSPGWVIEHDDEVKTRAGIVYGTPGFMAPEQLRGHLVNERTDVYALGATLYHLLSRKPPHHAKTADEMMRAAVRAPPVPIDQLVDGVPRELITIVDKALSADPKVRYQEARELAEDLQRFLTGQLVAAHHYTPREKLMRFAVKNRVPIMIAGAAALALLVVGVIAVTRVIGERDRADAEARSASTQRDAAELARRDAEHRTEKLTLQQARSKVASNPTEAIAMIKPLAHKQWEEVRSIAAAARVAGVAWSMPAPKRAESVEMSRDGHRVLVAGVDGSVQIYDLVARTTRVLVATGPRVNARFADRERKVVIWATTKLAVLDLELGTRIDLDLPSSVADLEVVGVTAYYADHERKLWQLDLAGRVPLEIATEEGIEQVSPSPDGRWIALAGLDHLYLYDRTQPALPPKEVLFGKVRDLDWSDDGAHLAVLFELGEQTERVVADLSIAAGAQVVHRFRVGQRRFVAWSQDRMFTIGPTGVGVVSRSETTPRKQMVGEPVGLRESYDRSVVAASHGGLAILTDDGDAFVPLPLPGRLEIVDASSRSPYVVGFIEGRMLVWNLAEMLPRRLAKQSITAVAFTGNDRVLVTYLDTTAEWIDLATGKARSLGTWPASIRSIDGAKDGRAACVIDATHQARLVTDAKDPDDLGAADFCLFAGGKPILATTAGAIDVYDTAARTRRSLLAGTAKLAHVTTSRGPIPWVAAAFVDGTISRHNLATGTTDTFRAAAIPAMILLQPDGVVVFPEGRMLRSWRLTGDVQPLVELPKPVTALGIAGVNRAVAFVESSGAGYVVSLDVPNTRSEQFELPAIELVRQSPDTGTLAFTHRGTIEIFDPIALHRWTLASSPGLTFTSPLISNDALHVLARRQITDREKREVEGRDLTVLLAWTFELPVGPDATARWLDRLTNAVVDVNTSNLVWQ